MDAAKADGNTITVLSDAETAKVRKMVQPITDAWVAKADKAGLDGKALLADYHAIVSGL